MNQKSKLSNNQSKFTSIIYQKIKSIFCKQHVDDQQQHFDRESKDQEFQYSSSQSQLKIQQVERQDIKVSNQSLKYVLIDKYEQQQVCHAIAFNQDGTIMINGCQDEIIVSGFQNGSVKVTNVLKGHTNQIVSLCFGSNNDEFFSGSTDKSIVYWKKFNQSDWSYGQALNGHKRLVDCILFNKRENQLISCSCDKTIRIWMRNIEEFWQEIQRLTTHTAHVRCISLNQSETNFVSCSEDKLIIIWEIDNSKQWKQKQVIETDEYGYRICFINDSMIAWQPRSKGTMIIFENQLSSNSFALSSSEIQLNKHSDGYQNFFPSIYNDEKQVLINKHGKYVYVLRKCNNNKFRIEQVIDVGHYCNYGVLTPDGNYLVIWDEGSKQMQVRKLK